MLYFRRLYYSKLIIATAFAVCCVTIFRKHYYIHRGPLENVSCHNENEGDILPSAESREFSPAAESIFFHETSCRGGLNSRQACAVEAAARAHPHREVYVLFSAPIKIIEGSLKTLQNISNINFARLHVLEYTKGTPLEPLVSSGALYRTPWRVAHTSDALRLTTLYKWGGVYLDLDTVVVKPFDELNKNWAAREDHIHVANGALSFSRDAIGRRMAHAAIIEFATRYDGDVWGINGPGVITRVLKKLCGKSAVTNMTAYDCHGFEVYGPEMFYPVPPGERAREYFEPGELDLREAYVYHVWNKATSNMTVLENSRYANLARRYCPSIYNSYGRRFGS